jgi:hypothetical protein
LASQFQTTAQEMKKQSGEVEIEDVPKAKPDEPVKAMANMNAVKQQLSNINKDKKARFGPNLTAKEYLKRRETTKWVEKKQLSSHVEISKEEEVNRKNIEFAKNLFISWDDDGSGVLEA